jgi:CRP/FNR family transcriptional regulator
MTLLSPSIRAIPFDEVPPNGLTIELLTEQQRSRLAEIATVISLPHNAVLYGEDSPVDAVFLTARGVLKAYRDLPSGRQLVVAFMFPADVFGLAQAGRYVNSVAAVTPAVLYRIPLDDLKALFHNDAALQFQFLCKVTHELRESQRQVMVLTRRDAIGRLAMFLVTLERDTDRSDRKVPRTLFSLPMSRTDIASYLGVSLEAVSRCCSRLVRDRIVAFPDRHHVRILDRSALDKLASAL